MLLLDTCALIFWTLDPKKLTDTALRKIKADKNICISSISIWEVGIKIKRKKLTIPLSFESYVKKLKQIEDFQIIPVDEHIWIKNIQLKWEHRDPADRTIVATAFINDCGLVTSNKKILGFYAKALW